jgi:hypothetical protein
LNYDILYFLIFLHYLADFPLQGQYLAENKGKNDYLLFAHAFIWSGIISIGLVYFSLFTLTDAFFLLIGHFYIDRWKARLDNSGINELIVDQILHLIQIIIVIII